jgi:hypothetical protein
MAIATQAVITIGPGTGYASLGTTGSNGMMISPEGEIEIILASSQPTANAPGHPIGMSALPYLMPLFPIQVWAMSATGASVAVTVSF